MSDYWDHPEWAAWLASIREVPDDDHRRLICADWLEERGQAERAEFIRVCIETEGVPIRKNPDMGFAQWKRLADHRDDLFRRHADVWFGKAMCHFCPSTPIRFEPPECGHTVVNRGFIESVCGPLAALAGGACGRCGGNRMVNHVRGEVQIGTSDAPHPLARGLVAHFLPCDHCRGTGRTPGVLPALWSREPLMKVVVTDREPHWNGRAYCWYVSGRARASGGVPEDANLPEALVTAVHVHSLETAAAGVYWLPDRAVGFPTPDAARKALSAALIRWCESHSEVQR